MGFLRITPNLFICFLDAGDNYSHFYLLPPDARRESLNIRERIKEINETDCFEFVSLLPPRHKKNGFSRNMAKRFADFIFLIFCFFFRPRRRHLPRQILLDAPMSFAFLTVDSRIFEKLAGAEWASWFCLCFVVHNMSLMLFNQTSTKK